MKQNLGVIALVVAVVAVVLNIATPLKPINVSVELADNVVQAIKEASGLGSAGNEYGENVKFNDGATFATRGTGGGVLRGDGMAFASGTTTPCTLRSPTNATSTLVAFNLYVSRNGTTTAREVSIATSTVPYATTSPILDGSLLAIASRENFAINVPASTTPPALNSRFALLPPGTYINVSLKGGNHRMGIGTTTELAGSCSALFLAEGK